MKKRIIILFLFLSAVFCSLGIAACAHSEPTPLPAPSRLEVSDEGILTWNKIDGASSYLVEIDDNEYETQTNDLDIFMLTAAYKTFDIKVTAYGDFENYLDSEPSEVLKYTVSPVAGLKMQPINNGEAYKVVMLDRAQGGKLLIPSVVEGKPVVEIGGQCFKDCKKLTSVVLPDTVEKIGTAAFSNCENLKRVRLPYYLKTLDTNAFGYCSSLTKITLPPNLEEVGPGIFKACDSLVEITMPENTGLPYAAEGNCLIRRQDGALLAGCKASVIPDYVRSIEEYAFGYLKSLKQITLSDGVETIGFGSFQNAGLTQLHLPSGVRSINKYAFSGCTALEKVVFSEGLETIGNKNILSFSPTAAFGGCTSLKSVFFPASLSHIDGSTFLGCVNLEEIEVAAENKTYKSDGNRLIRKADNCLVLCGSKALSIPDYVKGIGDYAFYDRELTEIELPDGLEKIGDYAFYNNGFTEIELPDGLKEIGRSAFKACKKLKSVAIPSSVEYIAGYAFRDCHALSVVLPETIKTIEAFAFDAASIYTSAKTYPDGWEHDVRGQVTYSWYHLSSVVWGCRFGYDGTLPYVASFEQRRYSISEPVPSGTPPSMISFGGTGIVLNNYRPVPMRRGYRFAGWATEEGSNTVVYPITLADPKNFVYSDDVLPEDRYDGEPFYASLPDKEVVSIPSPTVLYAVWVPADE